MALTATTNTTANTALRYLDRNNNMAANSLAKLSSGSRIVRASDDAASLAIGTKIKADVTALKQAQVNAGQASSVLQVADGAMSQTVDILMRMKALSVQSQSGSVSDNERGFLDKEFQALRAQIDDIANQTKFNGTTLLNGSMAKVVDAAAATGVPGTIAIEFTGSAGDGTFTLEYADAAQVGTFTLTAPGGSTYTATIDTTGGGTFSGTLDFGAGGVSMVLDTFAFTDSNANDFNTNNTYDVLPA